MLVVIAGCTPVHNFAPAGDVTFEPRPSDHPIEYFPNEPPQREYIVIGYVDCRGDSVKDVLPWFEKMARKHGGDAIIDLKSTQVYLALQQYTATVIRYK
jgi:hypothetical protein